MILAFDVGNSSYKWARFAQGRRLEGGRLPLAADLAALPEAPDSAAVSVNPAALERLRQRYPRMRVAGRDFGAPIPVHYRPPSACGLDRVLTVLGALHRRPEAAGVLTLDLGTCLVGTVGVRGRGILGGAILPGFDLMARSLAEGTAALPLVAWGPPGAAVGGSTEESIRAGLWAALRGACSEIIAGTRSEVPGPLDIVAVGSGAGALAAVVPLIECIHPFATLWGVYLAASAEVEKR